MVKSQKTVAFADKRLYYAQPYERDDPIVFPAEIIRVLAPVFEVSTTGMARLLGMSRHVVWRKIHRREALPPEYQARALGAVRVYVLALDLYSYHTVSRRQEARQWLNDWLRTPLWAFGWRKPLELLDSDKDQKALLTLLARVVVGVYT
jgi:putative toxin-antitoxin system antitoxin component (TIGR02293 family)